METPTMVTLERDVQCPICKMNYRLGARFIKSENDQTLGGITVAQQACIHPDKQVTFALKEDGYVVQTVIDLPKKIYIQKACGDDCDCSCNDWDESYD